MIPEPERDKSFGDKLRAEWPGILAWMIEGCTQWQRSGLAPPKAVTSATDRTRSRRGLTSSASATRTPGRTTILYAAWKDWADKGGEYAGNMRHFAQNLETRGITYERSKKARGFRGLRLIGDTQHYDG